MTTSTKEIERWTSILERNETDGKDRLRWYLASRGLGRDFGESVETYFARRGLTEFAAWARSIL